MIGQRSQLNSCAIARIHQHLNHCHLNFNILSWTVCYLLLSSSSKSYRAKLLGSAVRKERSHGKSVIIEYGAPSTTPKAQGVWERLNAITFLFL